MSVNNNKDEFESNRGYDARNPSNPTKQATNTIRLRQKHWEEFERLKNEQNISLNGFINNLMEVHFKSQNLKMEFPIMSQTFGLQEHLTIIGDKIKGSHAKNCLLAWLKNSKFPPFEVPEKAQGLYQELYRFINTLPRSGEVTEMILESSRETLAIVQQNYEYEVVKHLGLYKTLVVAAGGHKDSSAEKNWIIEQVNYLIGMEDMMINNYCMISGDIRFAAYNCWKNNVLRDLTPPAEWRTPYRDDLIAMNRQLVEIRDGQPIHV